MAKASFSKLGLKINNDIINIEFNDQLIEVKQYLLVSDKLKFVENVINNSADDMKFYNCGKLDIFFTLEVLFNYTNLNITDKQKEDVCKLYDIVISSGLYDIILSNIPKEEIIWLHKMMEDTVKSIYSYQNSAMGIIDSISADYSALNLEAGEIQSKLANPENMKLLKDVLNKLG